MFITAPDPVSVPHIIRKLRLGSVIGCVYLTALPLLIERFKHDTKVLTVIDGAGRGDRQHLAFRRLTHAREVIGNWRRDYNENRPHSALGYQTPLEFAVGYRAIGKGSKLTDITKQ